MNSKKLVAWFERGDGWRSGWGVGERGELFKWNGFEWRLLGWHMAAGTYERFTPALPVRSES